MIIINWIITDDIKGISLNEFNLEWNEIYGYFELCINNRILGYCPKRELLPNEEGLEDILYWLLKLVNGIMHVKNGEEYEIQLLSMNLTKIILKENHMLEVEFVNVKSKEYIWNEKIEFNEFCEVICNSIDKLLEEIEKNNINLLQANKIKKLSRMKDMIKNQ